jgi:hypothetical protein
MAEKMEALLVAQGMEGEPITAGLPATLYHDAESLYHDAGMRAPCARNHLLALFSRPSCLPGGRVSGSLSPLACAVCMLGSEHIVSGSISGRVRYRNESVCECTMTYLRMCM